MRRRPSASTGPARIAFTRIGPLPPLGFVGREAEVREVLEALRAERLVVLVGAVGSGKSELLHEVARRAGRRTAEVACRRDDTFDAVHARVERRLDAVAGGLGAALDGALLVVDDVHLLGTGADRLCAELSRASSSGWVLLASEEHIPLRQGGREVALAGMSLDDARALWTRLEELHGPTPHGAVDTALVRTRAPLALRREFAQAQRQSGKAWDVATLPRAERRVLAALAVCALAGRALLARLAGGDETAGEVDAALAELVRRQVVSVTADGRFVAHEVTRAAVLGALDGEERRRLEIAAAAVLVDDPDRPDRVERVLDAARHLATAERFAEAIELLRSSEDVILVRGGAGEALALVEQVARRFSDLALTSLQVRVLLRCGRIAAAREALEPVAARAAPELQLAGAELALAAGEPGLASARVEPLLAGGLARRARELAARIDVERGRRAPEPDDSATPLLAQGRLDEADAALAGAEQAARASAESLAADELARRRALVLAAAGRLADAHARLAALAAQARERGAHLVALRAEADLAAVLVQRGRAGAASAIASAVAEEADARGLALIAAEAELAVAAAELEAGRPESAAQSAAALARAPGEAIRDAARRVRARAAAWTGEAAGRSPARAGDDPILAAELALAAGDGELALDRYLAAAASAEKAGRAADLAAALVEAARLHHTRGERARAAAAVARALSEGSAGGADRTVARALLVGAALAREDGDLTAARAALNDALTIARAAGLALERYAAARAAETLARLAGDGESVDTLASVGRAAAATMGEPALAAAERLLADLGLADGCGFRITTVDGGVSYAAQMDPVRLGLERRALVVDGAGERVLRSGKRVADLRRRTLLKRLLFLFAGAPGRLYSKEEIVERIWGVEYHPLHHDAALFTNVMRLRRLLGPGGADILRVAEGGYLLAPPRDFLFVERLPV